MTGLGQVVQGALFYEFSIESFVPKDHPVRGIDRFLDLTDVRPLLAPYYSANGRPSIDPELMIRIAKDLRSKVRQRTYGDMIRTVLPECSIRLLPPLI